MTDEIEKKRNELFEFVREFHDADDHAEGLDAHPKILRQWLDKLFVLSTELFALRIADATAQRTRSFSVDVVKGEASHFPGGVERQ